MRWFKHYVDSGRGRFLQQTYQKLGHRGISCYWSLVELCAEKLEENPDCNFAFDRVYLAKQLHLKSSQLELVLTCYQVAGQLSLTTSEMDVIISMPKLLKILNRDSNHARTTRATTAPKNKNKNKNKNKIIHSVFDFEIIYNLYPKKVGKSLGLKKLSSDIATSEDYENIKKAVIKYKNHCILQKTESQFIKHFSTWVGEWRDWLSEEIGSSESFATDSLDDFARRLSERTGQ